jgi:hypothetical protein
VVLLLGLVAVLAVSSALDIADDVVHGDIQFLQGRVQVTKRLLVCIQPCIMAGNHGLQVLVDLLLLVNRRGQLVG